MPRQWSYPTTQWDANEVVSDVLTLKLEQADARSPYRIVLGVYDEQTGGGWRRWMRRGRGWGRMCWS
ncbi:MAG: hypothetical protein R2911_27810 [Caldilineaceae bacterium]